jgi:hypothetical protein
MDAQIQTLRSGNSNLGLDCIGPHIGHQVRHQVRSFDLTGHLLRGQWIERCVAKRANLNWVLLGSRVNRIFSLTETRILAIE